MTFTRLFPDPGPHDPALVELPRRRGPLPYLIVSMAATADGRAVVDGGSKAIGSGADMEHVSELRVRSDAILVAPETLRAEDYRRPVRRADRLARRGGRSPLVATVSRSGDVPWEVPLFDDPEAEVVVFSPSAEVPPAVRATVSRRRETQPAELLSHLAARGCELVLGEGGPAFNHALFAAGVVDELFLTVAPVVAGGADAPTIVEGPPLDPRCGMELVWVLLSEAGDLFCRYRIRR